MIKIKKSKQTRSQHVVILGAGLAGLAAGYELTRVGYKVTLVERWEDVGGLARTITKNRFSFDTGPHRWYTKNDMVNKWMLKLLGSEIIQVPRLTRIYFDQTFFHYPIKIKSTLKGMGLVTTIQAVIDYLLIRLLNKIDKKEAVNLEEGYVNKFGRTLYRLFFKRYSEKLWGTSCRNISADWIGQRTRGFNITTIIKDILFRKKDVVSFVDEFLTMSASFVCHKESPSLQASSKIRAVVPLGDKPSLQLSISIKRINGIDSECT